MLLDKLHMQAVLSLEAVIHMIGALARDLQGDFIPLFPRLCAKLAELVSAGAPCNGSHSSRSHGHGS